VPPTPSSRDLVCLNGRLTDEGTECQTFRTTDAELYSLVGDLKSFKGRRQGVRVWNGHRPVILHAGNYSSRSFDFEAVR
jgi:hypothetical protein